jgi:glucokinase
MVFKCAEAWDEAALMVIDEIGEVNAVGFADIANCFDPEFITVGGSVALRNPEMILNPERKKFGRYLIGRPPRIELTALGGDAVLYGALAAMLD